MLQIEPSVLIRKLNRYCTSALEAAAGVAVSRGHYEITIEHLLGQLCQDPAADIQMILLQFGVDPGRVLKGLDRSLESQRSGNTGRPVFSPHLISLMQSAWLLGSAEQGWTALRSGSIFVTLLLEPHTYTSGAFLDLLEPVPKEELRKQLASYVDGSLEEEQSRSTGDGGDGAPAAQGPHGRGPETALGRFTQDFTAEAREGSGDPIIGREAEIRQCIDVLGRRRKNNPIIVGEAGVGKTALIEGLAQRIVAGEVPTKLRGVEILGLDMGLLQAGAGVKGEFENRLKSVIEEVQSSPTPIIVFIDEAHTLIGAGGPAGGSDAANLLKPALARGELRTLAATTWTEYKKYFESDPALTRRFQLIKVEEPSEKNCTAMMRAICPNYERSHGVAIRDEACVAAVELSNRYISGRQMPDKSVDLLDTCAARVGIAYDDKPPALQDLEHEAQVLQRELAALLSERTEGYDIDPERITALEEELLAKGQEAGQLEARWLEEQEVAHLVVRLRKALSGTEEEDEEEVETAVTVEVDAEAAAEVAAEAEAAADAEAEAEEEEVPLPTDPAELRAMLDENLAKLAKFQEEEILVPVDVSADLVAQVVSDWTGVPLGKMVEDESATLLKLEERIGERIKGQDFALGRMGEGIRGSKMGLTNPEAPNGVFLFVGPSGVGKTETGLALADLLYGGERFMVTINMSEFQEKHTVSRLIGSPPGYVGYGEGGVLTEAVRQRPYSLVMLDEVEKADPEVMNLFYQVFDKGTLSDGQGRIIDFKNTIVIMTSNLGSDVMTAMCAAEERPEDDVIVEAVRPILSNHFKPALLARMKIVPYLPLNDEAMRSIVALKLGHLEQRMMRTHKVKLTVADNVVDQIADRCGEVETGARNIDHIMSRTLLPLISNTLLGAMSERAEADALWLDVDENGEYTLSLEQPKA